MKQTSIESQKVNKQQLKVGRKITTTQMNIRL